MKELKHEESRLMGLSEDLTLEILLRLPLKSLGRFKCVSKTWRSLISNPKFAKFRLQFSNNPPLTLVLQKFNIISLLKYRNTTDISEGVDIIPMDQQFGGVGSCDGPHGCYCFLVGSCDGLVCLYVKIKRKICQDSLHLWNPTTNEHKQITLPMEYGLTYLNVKCCWFGFVPSLDDYKVFLVYKVGNPVYAERVHVYSVRNHRWREIQVTGDVDSPFASETNSVFMNEALHFVDSIGRQWIHKFDLVVETFERVPFSMNPDVFPVSRQVTLGVIGIKKCICAMFIQIPVEDEWMFELWMLEEYNKWDSWKKVYRIDLKNEIVGNLIGMFGFTYGGNLCLDDGNGLRLIDPSQDPPSYYTCRGIIYKTADFVESLISPSSLN